MNNKEQTPMEALQMLYAYARKAQYQGPLEEATAHLEALDKAGILIETTLKNEGSIGASGNTGDIEQA